MAEAAGPGAAWRWRSACWLLLVALLLGCAPRQTKPPEEAAGAPDAFALRIVHINDHHSRLDPDADQTLLFDGVATEISMGGFARVVAAFRHLAGDHPALLKLHAGDATTGDLYYTLFQGEADADLMNQICFDAFAVGNHEFDFGDLGLKRFLDFLSKRTWPCQTPALGANIRPALHRSPLARFGPQDYIAPSVVLQRGGWRIGIVGVDISGKTMNASRPDPGTLLLDEYTSAQQEIDRLRADGVDIIILLSHIGYHNDLKLAERLSDVDVIVGGDSHSLLGEEMAQFGLNPVGPYPTKLSNADGDAVCVVQAWQYSWAVGRLDLKFDAAGRVQHCEGSTVILLGDDPSRGGTPLTGVDREALLEQIDRAPPLLRIDPDPIADQVLGHYRAQLERFADEVLTQVPERLCLRRVPVRQDRGRDPSPGCARATDIHGGHVQDYIAQTFLSQAQRYGGADIALQNAGGVRNGIAPGAFTVADAFRVLPYKNTLLRLKLTGAELRSVLEGAIGHYLKDPSANSGAWPYAAGLRWHVDLTRSEQQGRSYGHEVWRDGAWQPLNDAEDYVVIASDFILSGGDGYRALADLPPERRGDTVLEYAQALVDHLRGGGTVTRPTKASRSTQSFRDRQ